MDGRTNSGLIQPVTLAVFISSSSVLPVPTFNFPTFPFSTPSKSKSCANLIPVLARSGRRSMAMEIGSSVKLVLLDNSVLIDSTDRASLQPGADSLLRHLRHSKIPTRIVYRENLPADQVDVLNKVAELYSLKCFHMDLTSVHDDINEMAGVSGDNKGIILYVISGNEKDLSSKLRSCNLVTVVLGQYLQEQKNEVSSECESNNPSPIYINGVQELPLVICNLIRKKTANDALKVGYIMKPSRIEDFAKRGAFPVYPSQNGLMFIPLTFELPLASQVQEVDIVLHKATDEIVSVDLSNSSECSSKIIYSRGIQELKRYVDDHPECCIIDPFHKIYPVLDRLEIQQVLCGLEDLGTEGRCKIRAAHFLKVDDFHEQGLVPRLEKAKCSPPYIVKPQIACGVADAHSMAIVFRTEDIKDLKVPLPAIIQEYVDHSSTIYKFYVLGKRVFHAVKKSIPNAPLLMKLCESNGLKPLAFDSLKSLPTSAENSDTKAQPLDLDLVNRAAKWLMEKLELTIFGFDVVVEERSGDHVIVDVNYLPSFKEVPDDIALPAFWDAIRTKFESR